MSKAEKLNLVDEGDYYTLRCSKCKDLYTHTEEVIIQTRAEDEDGTEIRIKDCETSTSSVTVRHLPKSNILNRRANVYINISCEACNHITNICIEQHKGSTMLYEEKSEKVLRSTKPLGKPHDENLMLSCENITLKAENESMKIQIQNYKTRISKKELYLS